MSTLKARLEVKSEMLGKEGQHKYYILHVYNSIAIKFDHVVYKKWDYSVRIFIAIHALLLIRIKKNSLGLDKEPKKKHLMSLLHPIKYQWNIIGEQLNVQYDQIMSAQYNVSYNDTMKLSEVLQVWIEKRSCAVSWRLILATIEEPPIDNVKVGDEIRQFLTQPDIYHQYCSDQQSS